ncbi:MAG: flagella basal body P-ring formation protein FlgA, partial [Alphaproteobacteria bacterium]
QGDIERPVLVRKGSLVTMQVRHGAMVLSAIGKAMQDGALGDSILLLNPRTRRTVEGTVVAAGRVDIAMARAVLAARAGHVR